MTMKRKRNEKLKKLLKIPGATYSEHSNNFELYNLVTVSRVDRHGNVKFDSYSVKEFEELSKRTKNH